MAKQSAGGCSWLDAIPLLAERYHQEIEAKVADLRRHQTIYPPADKLYYALELTPFEAVKVVLLGQDPYHGAGQAHGLAFSVPEGVKTPPSLRNIFKEIVTDIYQGEPQEFSTDLSRWAKQGVLLLNASLTVEAKKSASHKNIGWQRLTDQIVTQLSDPSYASGEIGFFVQTFDETLAHIHFDSLTIR